MENWHYTLAERVFQEGVGAGADAEIALPKGRKLLIVGGAATQINMISDPSLMRPTTDVDFVADGPASVADRKAWAVYASEVMNQRGYQSYGGLTKGGAEARVVEVSPDFLIHFDGESQPKYRKRQNWVDGQFERSRKIEIANTVVRYQSPEDVIIGKYRRILKLAAVGVVNLDEHDLAFLKNVGEAGFDAVETLPSTDWLRHLMKVRGQNIEDLGRYGWGEVVERVERYKVDKDIYDACAVIGGMRARGEKLNQEEFKRNLSTALAS